VTFVQTIVEEERRRAENQLDSFLVGLPALLLLISIATQPWHDLLRHWSIYSVSPKNLPLNIWLWQVQTCTALHIIKRAQALMYLDYCHQILYKSIVPFSRFAIFTKRCQKVQLPAAPLTCFLCALTVFCVNVQHFPLMVSVGISFVGRTKLIFIDPVVNIKWFVLLEHATSFASHSFNIRLR